jgi:glycosyltransferase involved in cell wall biosynthesis
MAGPVISVVIPAFNAAAFLGQAIDSVLAQSVGEIEVIVVDDGSTDGTAAIARSYDSEVHYVYQTNRGMAGARNRGLQECRGDLVGLLDADDTWMPEKIRKQIDALSASPRARVCYTACLVTDRNLEPIAVELSPRKGSALEDLLLMGNVVGSISSPLIERRLLAEVGGFNPGLSHCADWDLWVRLARKTEFICLPEPLVTYRQHGGNLSRHISILERDSFQVLHAAFADPETPAPLKARQRRALARNWMVLAGCYFNAGGFRDCLRCATHAVRLDPLQVRRLLHFPYRRLRGTSDWRRRFL